MTLAVYGDLILVFSFETSAGLTSAFATKVINQLYQDAAEILGHDTYSASNEQIDSYWLKKEVVKAASRILNDFYYPKYRDIRNAQGTVAMLVPGISFNEKEEKKIKNHRLAGFEQIIIIDRWEA
jgi:hypothetical protein